MVMTQSVNSFCFAAITSTAGALLFTVIGTGRFLGHSPIAEIMTECRSGDTFYRTNTVCSDIPRKCRSSGFCTSRSIIGDSVVILAELGNGDIVVVSASVASILYRARSGRLARV